jgi:hypothetical protein
MTIEKTCFASPEDISAVRIECSDCGMACIFPIAKLGSIGCALEGNCVCGAPSGLAKGTKELQEVTVFCSTLGSLAANLNGRKIKMSLQMECPE